MNIDKQLSGNIILSATISATFSSINDSWTYDSDSPVTDLIRWTYYNDTTSGELKTRYLKREYRISRDLMNWSDWIEIEDLGEITAFPDITSSNDFYYQLKWTEKNGSIAYSHALRIKQNPGEAPEYMQVYPNPVSTQFRIKGIHGKTAIHIYNPAGNLMVEQWTEEDHPINVAMLAPGFYILKIFGNQTEPFVLRLIKV